MEVDRAWKDVSVFMVCIVVLTSPLLPLLLYFSPLFICTGLCAYALISVAPREIQSELTDQITAENSLTSSPPNDRSTEYSSSRSCVAWLQWLIAMDDHSRSSVLSLDQTPPKFDDDQEYTAAPGGHEEESITETSAGDVESDHELHEDGLPSLEDQTFEYNLISTKGSSSQELHPHKISSCKLQQTFDIRSQLQILTLRLYDPLSRIKSSECLSFLHRVLALPTFTTWWYGRSSLDKTNLQADTVLYSPLMLISQRIRVHLREDLDQPALKLTDDCTKTSPVNVLLKDPRPKTQNQEEEEEEEEEAEEEEEEEESSDQPHSYGLQASTSCSYGDHPPWRMAKASTLDQDRANCHDDPIPPQLHQSPPDQISEPRITVLQSIYSEGADPSLEDASEVRAVRGQTEMKDTQAAIAETRNLETTIFPQAAASASPQPSPITPHTHESDQSIPASSREDQMQADAMSGREDEGHMKVISAAKSWPTVQRVLASQSKEMSNFPSVMRTGNSLILSSKLSNYKDYSHTSQNQAIIPKIHI